ncbi:dihydrofolate reductase [Bacillus sp. HMF5848]|uniref:dihydrofolate reductase n=1 Tax=Bacillus sp. HMF5848 TaxID=2495421 RepID=UPI000F7A2B11|nr:dihydrofolate reductase [Bacillus sp. HMF5848]RSK27303.1 dihydrofolate reductase [Bacillus sp. HMF5848]
MISFIFAMDKTRLIGKNNGLPWHLPADLKYFKNTTLGHPIIMGRKTYQSIGKALPRRENIIITTDRGFAADSCTVFHSPEEAMRYAITLNKEVFVIGGTQIFKEFFSYADKLYITLIDDVFDGDTYFPPISEDEWKLISKEKGLKDENNPYDYYFLTYVRKNLNK